ncbi:MAG: DoxX family protein, partial [Chitinophagaceae bacterium]
MEVIIIKIVLAVIFTLSVVGKLTGKTKSTFENAGYSPIVMYATAIAEIIFTVGLFTRYELFATLGLLAIMGGAVLTLFRQKVKPAKYTLPLVTVVLLIALLILQISKSASIT